MEELCCGAADEIHADEHENSAHRLHDRDVFVRKENRENRHENRLKKGPCADRSALAACRIRGEGPSRRVDEGYRTIRQVAQMIRTRAGGVA